MVISDSDLAIEDSVFSGLSYFGQGALVVANSNVTFVNVTFSSCNNSAGESLFWQVTVGVQIRMRTALESGTGTCACTPLLRGLTSHAQICSGKCPCKVHL